MVNVARSDKGKLGNAPIMIPFGLECVMDCGYRIGVIATSYRYIVQRAGVRSGHAIVEGTRVGVHDVVALTKTGASVDEVVASFPRLTRAQVYECLAYYEDHQRELDPLIAAQMASAEE
jgi:uncharacterized protein (DUF433 family)